MAGLLNTLYSVVVVLLAVGGVAFVFLTTSDGSGQETTYTNWSLLIAVALFLGVLAANLLVA